MRTSIILLGIFVTFLSLWACESETLPPQNSQLGLEYFPLEVGRYAVYEVKEINYSVVAEPDTQQYQLKELVADSFPGQGGEIIYRLERFYREDDTQAWDLDSVWTARKNKQRIVVVENNIPQIKLVFPLDIGVSWDVNALNSREEQLYELRNTDDALLTEMVTPVDSLLSDELFTVIQAESQDTIINRVEASETYLKHVGLFYKKSLRLHYCASEPECVGLGILESGRDYRQTLIDYGYENK
ncbi:hypothetical protein PZB74_21995 [Porifericola rhodea]|uniref:hypothetical protein n=1 Tax=Porifericola rhodea TaxID=930972 RepID=UPI002665A942|nr:hypothetical protein [Porifericola rhodea]WKN31621.1 hypothetical protein PZB74_21995 [Porifericola rhodea]